LTFKRGRGGGDDYSFAVATFSESFETSVVVAAKRRKKRGLFLFSSIEQTTDRDKAAAAATETEILLHKKRPAVVHFVHVL